MSSGLSRYDSLPSDRIIPLEDIVRIRARSGVRSGHSADCKPRADGLEIIIRRQESAQEPMGSWRLSSLPRTHQAILRSTTGPAVPGSPLRAVRGAWKRPVRSPASPVVRSDWPVIHRSGCCLAIFSAALACSAGTGAGAVARPRCSSGWASVTAPALGPVIPHLPALGDVPPGRACPVPPVQ